MKSTTVAIYIFAILNIACIVALAWFNRNGDSLDHKRKEVMKKHLRVTNEFPHLITENEYYAKEKRFSVVVVTHKETMLEKTYPFLIQFG